MPQKNQIVIRPETLLSFPNWVQPTPDEIREVIRLAGVNRGLKRMTGVQVADLVGVASTGVGSGRGSRTVRSWVGQGRIPYAAWAILCAEAGLGFIWRSD